MGKKIMDHIRDFLTKDLALKILSVLMAALLWLLVVNLDDPTQSRNFTATVTIENEDVLTDAGKYYELPDGNTVTFRVTARRSIIESLSASDFSAVADMNDLEDESRIPISIYVNRYSNKVSISAKTHYISVSIGNKAQNTFTVKANITGEPQDGYAMGNVSLSPSTISVDGPAEIVDKIDSVMVDFDVSDLAEDSAEMVTPVFYDEDKNEIKTDSLMLSANSIEVYVEIESIRDVGITVETSGELPEGYELDKITTDPDKIHLIGDSSIINNLTTITIPQDVINLSQITGKYETTVDISSYLPEGVSVDEDDQKVKITVTVFAEETKEFSVNTANLTVRNLTDGLEAKFTDSTVTIPIKGLSSDLSSLNATELTGYVDASGLTEGDHAVSIVLDLDDKYEITSTSTNLKLTKTSTSSSSSGTTQ